MKRIKWSLEETVAIVNLYFRFENGMVADLNAELTALSRILNRRADILGIAHDEKFRNLNGMKCIFQNIRYLSTGGKVGLSNTSKLHSDTVELYFNDCEKFNAILKSFREKYCL